LGDSLNKFICDFYDFFIFKCVQLTQIF
jgi:hypothetical protein